MSSFTAKRYLATICYRVGATALIRRAYSALLGPNIRAINYHDVPWSAASAFEDQIRYFADAYTAVDLQQLRAFIAGSWRPPKTGLIITFDDGLRSHADVAAPILEKFGFSGWFMVPTEFVSTPVELQARWGREHQIRFSAEGFDDDRIALSIDDLVRLDARHVIGCHTRTHCRLESGLDTPKLSDEISGSKVVLETWLGHEVPVFTWVGGEEQSYSAAGAAEIARAQFEFGFMTNSAPILTDCDQLQLQRSNIEADFPMELTQMVLSGLYDLLYWPKRSRVNRLTKVERVPESRIPL